MKVAVLGFGTVGVGVYEMLKTAQGLEPGPVLVRPGKADAPYKVTSLEEIVNDESVQAVVEVMGGIEPAYTYAVAALEHGKHFVTSNKALVAAKGVALNKLAREKGVAFLFSAACGGAVPILHNLALARESDKILALGGILNGTTNYMLDAMQRLGLDYGDALADAQRLGYAEADPTADVSGLDALRKIMLADAVAYGLLPQEGLLNEGIPPENLIYYGLEYKFLTQYIIGELSYDEMVRQLEIAIHQFAKRQMTWFRGMERRGFHIHWVTRPENDNELNKVVDELCTNILS